MSVPTLSSDHRDRRSVLAATIVSLAALIVAFVMSGADEGPAVTPGVATKRPAAATSSTTEAAATNERTPRRVPVSHALQREFMEAPDLYAFAAQARRRPAEGGLVYAAHASLYCFGVRPEYDLFSSDPAAAEIARTATVSPQRIAAAERYQRLCAGFLNTGPGEFYRAMTDPSIQRSDPLRAAQLDVRQAFRTNDIDARLSALKTLLDFHDSLLLAHNVAYLVDPDRVVDGPAMRWFEQHAYRTDDESKTFDAALRLAICLPETPCLGDEDLMIRCAMGGLCNDTLADAYFRPSAGAIDWPAGFEDRVRALADRMRDALSRSDVDAFRSPGSR